MKLFNKKSLMAVLTVGALTLSSVSAFAADTTGTAPATSSGQTTMMRERPNDLGRQANFVLDSSGTCQFSSDGQGFMKGNGRGDQAKAKSFADLTDEEKATLQAEITAKLAEKLAAGEITQEQYDESLAQIEAGEMPRLGGNHEKGKNFADLTEEEKADLQEKMTARLDEKLAAGEITQDQYDESLAQIEAGEMPRLGGCDKMGKDFANLTDEEKATLQAEMTARLDEKLAAGEITQDQYNESLAQIEAGEIPHFNGHQQMKGQNSSEETGTNELI